MTSRLKIGLLTALCTVVLLGAAVVEVRADARADARAALNRGLTALGRDDPRTARVELMNAIRTDPRLAAARVAQARVLLMLGDGRGAAAELERAIALGNQAGPLRHLLARAALLRGDAETALSEARAADADSREAPLLARLEGQAQQHLGHYDAAAAAFRRALDMAPNDPAVRADIARLHFATGDIAAALRSSDAALGLAPKDADALLLRAVLARDQYGPEAAGPWFDAALTAKPDHVSALIEYAATQADIGRAGQALALTRRALVLSPGSPRAFYIQAVIAARAGYYDLSRSLLTRTKGVLDGQAGVRLLRGVLHLHAGNATLAVGELEHLLDAQPLNIRARLLLARALFEDGQYPKAERVLVPLVERSDADSYVLTLAARINEEMGRRAVANGFLERAAALSIGPSSVYLGAGNPVATATAADADAAAMAPNLRHIRALLEAGQGDAAITRARMLVAANPGTPAAYVALGDCLAAADRFSEAATAYEQAGNMRFDEAVALRLVDTWRRIGDTAKAQQVLDLFLAQNPMNVEGQRLAASFLLASGQYGRALALLSSMRERLGNGDALLMTDTARAYAGLNRAEAALPYAAHAWRLQPASAVAADILGWTLFQADAKDRRALELLEKAQMLAPGEPLVKLHLGQVYAAWGDKANARIALQAAARSSGFARRDEAEAALKAL